MIQFKHITQVLFHEKFVKKIVAYGLLMLLFYFLQNITLLFFLTFIFGYLIFSVGVFFKTKFDNIIDVFFQSKSTKKLLKQAFSLNVIIIIQYIGIFILLFLLVSQILPQLIKELYELSKSLPFLQNEIQNVTDRLEEVRLFNTELWGSITQIVSEQDIQVVKDILVRLRDVGRIFLEVFLALILSIVFIFDRERVIHYFSAIKHSNFKFLYEEYELIFERWVKSFGLIIKAQSLIALTNSILTTLGLSIIWYVYGSGFPFILSLALLVLVFGFVPVLGTFLSSVPLIIIAFLYVWWLNAAFTVVALVVIVHAIEAYYLNPKIFSSFLELPVSLTFLILIVSEYFLWMAGLLVGVSLFYFIVGLISDTDNLIWKTRKKSEK